MYTIKLNVSTKSYNKFKKLIKKFKRCEVKIISEISDNKISRETNYVLLKNSEPNDMSYIFKMI